MWIDLKKLSDISDAIGYLPNICVDVANGYTDDFVDFCNRARCFSDYNNYNPIIMAGNVCTPEMVQEIILHGGVDIVKIGIGPGSACTTRLKTGVGYPQLSAIEECAHAAHGLRKGTGRLGLICADGGCRHPADVVKAFAAGADFVMLGGMLAGTDECEGEWKYVCDEKTNMDRKDSLLFYGMSSQKAQEKHGEGLKEYRSSEGRVINIPYKGPAKPRFF
jgi:GMP reductase